ncbi:MULTISPECIES: GNAT family N-acetyltransferase [unclassified Microbulbifer]|uniref:GNAT family N-acetyltransferase n=1 Tax=unclassified Microbulbifer TaxID=2619833 RepID=UPI0027E49240|nr:MULTISPECIES: GNAT family N-acetyltransferase [unclassified Microbulbifer]
MKVVPIGENDWESLKDIRLESLRDSPDAFGITYEEAKELSAEKWKSIASGESGLKFLLARCNGDDIGLIGGVYADGEYELVSMWVNPTNRGCGVGSSLVKALLRHAQSEGFVNVVLNVSPTNEAACSLYSKIGFKALEEAGTLNGNSGKELQKMAWHSASEP